MTYSLVAFNKYFKYVDHNKFNNFLAYSSTCVDKFCIMHINCRSLVANFDAVHDLIIVDLKSLFDVTVLTETWLQNYYASLYNFPGYKMFHSLRDNARGSRIYMYVKNVYNFQNFNFFFPLKTTFEHAQISVTLNGNVIIVSGIYRPPNTS